MMMVVIFSSICNPLLFSELLAKPDYNDNFVEYLPVAASLSTITNVCSTCASCADAAMRHRVLYSNVCFFSWCSSREFCFFMFLCF